MFDHTLRLVKERFFLPCCKLVAWSGVTPNMLTLASLVAGLACAYYAALGNYILIASAFWWVGRIFDGLDGSLARLTNQQSDFGGYLDIVCDFSVYALVPIGVVVGVTPNMDRPTAEMAYLVLSILQGTFFVNAAGLFMLSVILEKRQASKELTTVIMPRGLVEGFETMVAMQLMLLLPQHCILLMATFAAAVALTVLHRLRWAHTVL
jgi:phosphatidylglycerophosphate synthase